MMSGVSLLLAAIVIPSCRAGKLSAFAGHPDDVFQPAPIVDGPTIPWQIDPDGPSVNVTLTTNITGFPTKYQFGLNVPVHITREFYNKHAANAIKDGGFKFLRWPGGNVANEYIWNRDFNTFPWFKDLNKHHPPLYWDTDDFIKLCKETSCTPLVQINYAAFLVHGAANGTALAVSWLKHFRAHGIIARHWTLGNEQYGPWETPNKDPIYGPMDTGDLYGRNLQIVSKAMKAVDPELQLGGVLSQKDDPEAGDWNKLAIPYFAGAADFTVVHSYFMDPTDYSDPSHHKFMHPDTATIYRKSDPHFIGILRAQADEETERYGNITLPLALTEWNTDLFQDPVQDSTPNEMISALMVAGLVSRMMFSNLGFDANNFFALADAFHSASFPRDYKPGDLGILAKDDPSVDDGTPRPPWYTFALLRHIVGDMQLEAKVTAGPDAQSFVDGHAVEVVHGVFAHGWLFGSGEASVLVVNKNHPDTWSENISVCVNLPDEFGIQAGHLVRGWVISPEHPYYKDPAHDRGCRWNDVSSKRGVGGPFPITSIPALSANTSAPGCAALLSVPPSSVAGAVFYSSASRHVAGPQPKDAGTLLASGEREVVDHLTWIVSGLFACLAIVILPIACFRLTRPVPMPLEEAQLSREQRAQRDMPFSAQFVVRRKQTIFFCVGVVIDVCYLVWVPTRGWRDGAHWYNVLFLIAEILGTVSSLAYLVCGCFYPKPLKTAGQWTLEDSDEGLMVRARTERVAIVQCHYNEPVEDIAASVRGGLHYFASFGCSREGRKYYICDDGFFTGDGDLRKERQIHFCKELRSAVCDALGYSSADVQSSTENVEPLALTEGTWVDSAGIWRDDCATGFLIWCISKPEDHVYLVARCKPKVHHSKSGNINNFLYNVLPYQYSTTFADEELGTIAGPPSIGPDSSEVVQGFAQRSPPTYMLLMDQDMCLGHEYIEDVANYRPVEIIALARPVFETDLKRTAFVQFPQHFQDMPHVDVTFNSNATFYKGVQLGRGAVGLAAFSGTNCVWDISKLISIGGIQYGSLTEDSNTSIEAHRVGLRSRFVDMPVAAGNSPQSVEDAIKQVAARWAKGAVEMLLQRCCSQSPFQLCDDRYRRPPPGLEEAYGLNAYAHFKHGKERGMGREPLERLLMFIFSIESMLFPFWSLNALIHVLLATNQLATFNAPLSLKAQPEVLVVVFHTLMKMFQVMPAFPMVRCKEVWYSMAGWMGLAPTMLSHAVFAAFRERFCGCCGGASGGWTSIGQKGGKFYKPQLAIVFIAVMLLSMSGYRVATCAAAGGGPQEECPLPGTRGLASQDAIDLCSCEYTMGDFVMPGALCGTILDDHSDCFCHCCCEFSGQCGVIGKPKLGALRPHGSAEPCDVAVTMASLVYSGMLLLLSSPWVYAVLRDIRRWAYGPGLYMQSGRVESTALLEVAQHEADPNRKWVPSWQRPGHQMRHQFFDAPPLQPSRAGSLAPSPAPSWQRPGHQIQHAFFDA